ncbi:MAG: HAD family hydrolase [Bacteroidota bacterium]
MLIIDLDDTIFPTKSMNPVIFDPAISLVRDYLLANRTALVAEEAIAELWTRPIDYVLVKYELPEPIIANFYQAIAVVDYQQLEISPFADYQVLKSIALPKILVTTGLEELQVAKIKALGIRADFMGVFIDDPRLKPRRYKRTIFKQILSDMRLHPSQTWVIGDNPDSELKAGKEMGMNTIQRRSPSKESSSYADYEIDSFAELPSIIR